MNFLNEDYSDEQYQKGARGSYPHSANFVYWYENIAGQPRLAGEQFDTYWVDKYTYIQYDENVDYATMAEADMNRVDAEISKCNDLAEVADELKERYAALISRDFTAAIDPKFSNRLDALIKQVDALAQEIFHEYAPEAQERRQSWKQLLTASAQ